MPTYVRGAYVRDLPASKENEAYQDYENVVQEIEWKVGDWR